MAGKRSKRVYGHLSKEEYDELYAFLKTYGFKSPGDLLRSSATLSSALIPASECRSLIGELSILIRSKSHRDFEIAAEIIRAFLAKTQGRIAADRFTRNISLHCSLIKRANPSLASSSAAFAFAMEELKSWASSSRMDTPKKC